MAIEWTPEQQQEIDRIVAARLGRDKDEKEALRSKVTELSQFKVEIESSLAQKITEAVAAKENELKSKYESEITSVKAQKVKDEYLAGQKVKLPDAYKAMVETTTDATKLEASYKKAVEQFKADMKDLGVKKTIGSPSNPGTVTVTKSFEKMTMAERSELYQKDKELYYRLRDKKGRK